MGRYIGWTDVVNRYPDASKIGGAENISSSWIYGAESEIDARLASKYVTPFTTSPPPPLVADIAIDLTYYKATIRQKSSASIYEYVKDRFNGLLEGTMVLDAPGIDATAANMPTVGGPVQSSFGRDDPVNWVPAADAIEDSEDDRL